MVKYLEKNKERKEKEGQDKNLGRKLKIESPGKKFLPKSLSKEFLDPKNPIRLLNQGPGRKQILNVQVSKFNESYHKKQNVHSFEADERDPNEDFLNSFSFGRASDPVRSNRPGRTP